MVFSTETCPGGRTFKASKHYFPLSPAQKSIWFNQSLHPDLPLYNIGLLARVNGALNTELLNHALAHVVKLHDSLKFEFELLDGYPVLFVNEATTRYFEEIDLSSAIDNAELMARVQSEFSKPFALRGTLWKLQVLRINASEYWLLSKFHHLIADGLGINLFGKALVESYNALLSGKSQPDTPAPSYLSFIEDQQAYQNSTKYLKDRDFWLSKLKSAPAELLSAKTTKLPQSQSVGSSQVFWQLDRSVFQNIETITAQEGLAPVHFFTALLACYFARAKDVDELVIGLPMHNRLNAAHKQIIGMLASVVPLFIKVDFTSPFSRFMQDIAHEIKLGFKHQRFSIAELNRSLETTHAHSHRIYDVSLSFESFSADMRLGDSPLQVKPLHNGYEQLPLAVFVRDYHDESEVEIGFDFNEAYFSAKEADGMLQALAAMTTELLLNSHMQLDALPLLSDMQRDQVLKGFNAARFPYPTDKLIHQLVEEQVAKTPDLIALKYDQQALTYAELNAISNRVARKLLQFSLKPDDRIGVHLHRSLEMLIALLAVLKAGAAYVPLDPALPFERLTYLVDDSSPSVIITSAVDKISADGFGRNVFCLDEWLAAGEIKEMDARNITPLELGLRADHLAYVLYTSGSTGRPKGVMNQHDGVVNRLLWAKKEYRVGENEVILQKTPFNFDVSVWEFFLPLISGATLVMAPPKSHQDPAWLLEIIQIFGVTMVHFVPSMLSAFLSQFGSVPDKHPLKKVLCSGEALTHAQQKRFYELFPYCELHNLYGPTEAAIDVTYWRCGIDTNLDFVPIGQPIENVQIYILDRRLQPRPIGEIGEIYIGGIQVARGYWNQPELTHERFIKDPFSNSASARIYKTGDLGRWMENGAVEYLGRNDFQVKIRGFRIELGEIESALLSVSGVNDAVVIVREDIPNDKRLVAYLSGPTTIDIQSLHAELSRKLAEYMVPSAFVVMQQFPVTSNGKLDRRALPAPTRTDAILRDFEPPQGEIEHIIATVWQDILELDKVGRFDNFFRSGGNSLSALRVISRLREQYLFEISLRDFFSAPTIAEQALLAHAEQSQTEFKIHPIARTGFLPLSWAQQRLWFLSKLDKNASSAYHMPVALRIKGNLDPRLLQQTLDAMVLRHESLRTCFPEQQGEPYQHILSADTAFPLCVKRLQESNGVRALQEAERLVAQFVATPFDLGSAPLIRGMLIELCSDEHILVISQHHIISDGWSVGILIREISDYYAVLKKGEQPKLNPLIYQYVDYAAWQRQSTGVKVLQSQLDFWTDYLNGAPELISLPFDHARPLEQSFRGNRHKLELSHELLEKLKHFSSRHDATLFMTLLAAWSALLARLAGQKDLVIGIPIAGRNIPEVEDILGFFVNTLALRIRYEPEATAERYLESVKNLTLRAFANQDIPFEQVVDGLNVKRSLQHSPLFQVMLAYNNATVQESICLPGLEVTPVEIPQYSAHYDLTLLVTDSAGILNIELEYALDLFETQTARRIGEQFLTLLTAMLENDGQPLYKLALVSPQQLSLLAQAEKSGDEASDVAGTPHRQFERLARIQPEHTAVVAGEQRLSYEELNQRANTIADFLLKGGIGAENKVMLLTESSPDGIAAIIGILKSGAAYIPVDVSHPQERIKFILEDANPNAIITQTKYAHLFPAELPTILLDSSEAFFEGNISSLSQYSILNPVASASDSDSLAYVIYTSGSTGQPKAVMIQHDSLTAFFAAMQKKFEFNASDVWVQLHSVAFDFSVWEIFGALAYGGSLVMVSRETTTSLDGFHRIIQEQGVTILNHTPSEFRYLLAPYAELAERTALRYLFLGGEQLDRGILKNWLNQPGKIDIVNLYGPTESTICASFHCLNGTEQAAIPIGKPVPGTSIFILDEYRQPVAIGVTGEIYIGGSQLARGYLHDSPSTQTGFVTCELPGLGEVRLFKTGDLGRWRTEGEIEYLGRNDYQIKIRGYRVETGEIESRLKRHPDVQDAIVAVREEQPGEKSLVAYVVPEQGRQLDSFELRSYLAVSLADYMLPTAFVIMQAFPFTNNGKLDRSALPVPGPNDSRSRQNSEPLSLQERTLAKIWRELLHLDHIGLEDNFFELGGHSLHIVSLISRLRQQGWRIEVHTLLKNPALRDMAASLHSSPVTTDRALSTLPKENYVLTPEMLPLVSLTQEQIDRLSLVIEGGVANIQDIYPLSPLQEGILFHHMLEQQGDPYLLYSLMSFQDKALLDKVLGALQQVIDRHDILRTSLHWQGLDRPVQLVWRHASFRIQQLKFDNGSAKRALIEFMDPSSFRLDLECAPLLTAYIVEDAQKNEWLLGLVNHHIVCDHLTLELITEEIGLILADRAKELPESQPYRNFIANTLLQSNSAHESYFKALLSGITEPCLPFGTSAMPGLPQRFQRSVTSIPDSLAQQLRETARHLAVPPAVLFHVAWGKVIGLFSQQTDVVFGTVLSGRLFNSDDTSRVLGMFVNTLPVRVNLAAADPLKVIQQTYQQLSELLQHEQAALALVQRCSHIPSSMPLFSTLLNYRHTQKKHLSPNFIPGISLSAVEERTSYPVSVSIDDFESEFAITVSSTVNIDPARISLFLENALSCLLDAVNGNGTDYQTVSILPQQERTKLLAKFSSSSSVVPVFKAAHQYFEQWAASTPDAVAIHCDGRSLSYRELNQLADRLAVKLRSTDLKSDDRVAIRFQRGLEMIVAVIAVLKAGAAYVPIDPDYPAERQRYILNDSMPKVLISHPALGQLQAEFPFAQIMLDSKEVNYGLGTDIFAETVVPTVSEDDLAYVIYTSGSTGTPKGVMIEHGNLCHLIATAKHQFGFTHTDKWALYHSLAFDYSVWEMWGALANGGSLTIVPLEVARSAEAFNTLIQQQELTILNHTPSEFRHLIAPHEEYTAELKIRYLFLGAEALDPNCYIGWIQRQGLPLNSVVNLYGPTEATVCVSSQTGEQSDRELVPIGKPLADCRLYILDKNGQPLPIGVPGELHIAGPQVARGYLNRPDLNQQKFQPDPFFGGGHDRLYKTGDLARWRDDGVIEYLGRNDFQVKIRGFRIELGEIEARLLACAGISEAVVVALDDVRGEKQLVAYYVQRSNQDISGQLLKRTLAHNLADYMIPSAFVRLNSMPLNANGKLDRKSLPLPTGKDFVRAIYMPAQNKTESALAAIWQRLLDLPQISRNDNFFEIGGHSLLAARLMNAVKQEFNLPLPLKLVFEHPTVAEMADAIDTLLLHYQPLDPTSAEFEQGDL